MNLNKATATIRVNGFCIERREDGFYVITGKGYCIYTKTLEDALQFAGLEFFNKAE